ncbi:MAG: hypothetical protein ACFFDW_04180, partial [Candidatus Thorarchaeota archaeon]
MSDYEIKFYEKGVEDAQAELGTEVTKGWTDFGQTSAENLKITYSRPDFDPETRLYAFKDGKLVAFFVSRVLPEGEDGIKRATHDFPFVRKGHEDAGELLYKKAIETLKNKGVKIIDGRAFEGWPGTIEKAEKYGYKKGNLRFIKIGLNLNEIQFDAAEEKYQECHPENDKELIVKFFVSQFNMTQEQAENNFNGIINPPEGIYSQPIIKEDDKLISRGLVYIPKDPKIATFRLPVPDT